jgi:hypothetical protein
MEGTFPTPLPHAGLTDRSQMPSRVRSYASRVNKMLGLAKVPGPSFSSSRLLVWLPQLHEYGDQRDFLRAATDPHLTSPCSNRFLCNLLSGLTVKPLLISVYDS